MMKKIIFTVVALVLISQLAFSIMIVRYKNEVIMLPNSTETLNVFITAINESIEANISCISNVSIECPAFIKIETNDTKSFPITIHTGFELGVYEIRFSVGNFYNGTIEVKVSGVPRALEMLIEYYKFAVDKLKENEKIDNESIANIELDLTMAEELYRNGLYYECAEKLSNVRDRIENLTRKAVKSEGGNESIHTETLKYSKLSFLFVLALIILVTVTIFHLYRSKMVNGVKMEKPSLRRDLLAIKKKVGKLEKPSPEKMDIKTIERVIEKMKRLGEDVSSLEVDLALIKKLKRQGKEILAERYLERLKKRLEWDLW